jgi:hypothetical protein
MPHNRDLAPSPTFKPVSGSVGLPFKQFFGAETERPESSPPQPDESRDLVDRAIGPIRGYLAPDQEISAEW